MPRVVAAASVLPDHIGVLTNSCNNVKKVAETYQSHHQQQRSLEWLKHPPVISWWQPKKRVKR